MINEIERKTFWDDKIITPKEKNGDIHKNIESLIIGWEMDRQKTTGQLTNEIIKLFEKYGNKSI